MAYKDEYEVARLYTDGRFRAALDAQFEPGFRLRFRMAPPLVARKRDMAGRPRKMAFGPWVQILFRALAAMKGLRETPLDIFGWHAERRQERALRDRYLARVAQSCADLNAENHAAAVAIAELPLSVRGFGPVKAEAMARVVAAL